MRENLGLKFLAVAIAATLWIVVFGSRTIEITKDVPFEVVMNDDQSIEDNVPDKITFRLSGPKAFIRNISNRIEEPIRANLKDLKPGLMNYRVYTDSIKLPIGVKVHSVHPNVIPIRIEEVKRKMVNIQLELVGQEKLADRFVRAEILPPQISIKGTKQRISAITSIRTLPIDVSILQHTSIVPISFDLRPYGVELDSVLPEVNVEIQGKGQAFRVKHVPLSVKGAGKVKSDDVEVTVIVRTPPNEVVKVDGESVKAEIDARDLPDGEFLRWVKVQLPEKVHLVRVIPAFTRITVRSK